MLNVITSTATIINPQITTAVNGLFSLAFETGMLLLVAGLTWGIKLGLSMIHNSLVRAFATRAVAFAEQRIIGSNEEKRKAVAQKIHDKFPRLSTEEIDHFLEEAVVNLRDGIAATSVTQVGDGETVVVNK